MGREDAEGLCGFHVCSQERSLVFLPARKRAVQWEGLGFAIRSGG